MAMPDPPTTKSNFTLTQIAERSQGEDIARGPKEQFHPDPNRNAIPG
jgi:hypothetical protein